MSSGALVGDALALCALVLFSATIVLIKIASGRVNLNAGYLISVAVNVAFAGVLFGLQCILRDDSLRWDWRGFFQFMAAGAFSTYLGRWFNFEAISRLGAAKSSTFQMSSPLFAVIIAWVFLGERVDPAGMGAILLTLAGLLLVSVPSSALAAMIAARPRRGSRLADLVARGRVLLRSGGMLGIASSAAYAAGYVFRGAGIRNWDEPVLGTLTGAACGLTLQLVLGRGTAAVWRGLGALDRRGVVLFAVGGILTILAQVCVTASMRFIPVAVVSLITLCTPILVFPLSYFLLGNQEGIVARTVVGAVMTLAGIAILTLR